MKHIKLFEQFINEKKSETYVAYVDDKREPGGSDEEIKNDYNLDVKDRNSSGFSIVGAKEDIEAFIDDYGIILDDEIQVNEKAYQMTGMYGAKGIVGKVLFAFKKEIEKIKFEGDVQDTLKELNQVWSKWADKEGAEIIADEVMKQVKNKEAIVYIMAALSKQEWVDDQINGLNRPDSTELFVRIPSDFVINVGFADDVDANKYARKLSGMQNDALVSGIETTILGEYESSVGQNNIEIRQSMFLSIDAK